MSKLIGLCGVFLGGLFIFDYLALNNLSRTPLCSAGATLIPRGSLLAKSVEEVTNQPYEKKDE